MDKWDERFVKIVREVATWSKDLNKQVGAIAVPFDNKQIITAYNGPPAGFNDKFWQTLDKGEKNALSVHAELNLIINAQTRLDAYTVYITEAPCLGCAMALIQAGVCRIVHPAVNYQSSWKNSQLSAQKLLAEHNVVVTFIYGEYDET